MVALAEAADGRPVSLRVIAKEKKLPYRFLTQIVIPLRQTGLVTSKEGVRGGYLLAKPAKEITMGEMLRALDGDVKLIRCARHTDASCPSADVCTLPPVWHRVAGSISSTLESVRLSDLVRQSTPVHAAA